MQRIWKLLPALVLLAGLGGSARAQDGEGAAAAGEAKAGEHEGAAAEPAGGAAVEPAAEPAGEHEGAAAEPAGGAAVEPAAEPAGEHEAAGAAEPAAGEHEGAGAAEPAAGEHEGAAAGASASDDDEGGYQPDLAYEKELGLPPIPAGATSAYGEAIDPKTGLTDDGTRPVPMMTEDQAKDSVFAGLSMTDAQKADYAKVLRALVAKVRGKVLAKMSAKIAASNASKLDKLSFVLFLLAVGGIFLLAMPLVLKKKYPNQMGVMFKYSALAALLFFLAINLFAAVLMVMRGSQSVLGRYTNPQIKIVESTFDLIDHKAEDLVPMGKALIEPTVKSLTGETDAPVLTIMLQNVQRFKNDFTVFSSVGRFFKKLSWLFGMMPIILMALAVFLFVKVALPTLKEIIKLPERAAQGVQGVGRLAVKTTLSSVWREAKATFCAVGVLMVLTVLSGFVLGRLLEPALEIFLSYLYLAFLYVQINEHASSFWVLFSLMGALTFMVLNLVVIILTTSFFLGKAQQIFQRRFREGVPLASHAKFWKWGAASALWTQVLPWLYIVAAMPAIGWLVEKSFVKFVGNRPPETQNWAFVLASGPALFVVTFVVSFWLFRGFKALGFMKAYKVAPPAPVAAPELADGLGHATPAGAR